MEKKMEFSNYLLMFGRSAIVIYATCLAPIYSKFNAESNPAYPFGKQMKRK